MKHCSKHMVELRDLLRKKGLGRYIGDDADLSKQRAQLWLQGLSSPGDFDPLVVSVLEIYQKVTTMKLPIDELGGQERCPLCLLPHFLGVITASDMWMDNVTDAMVIVARAHGMRIGS